MIKNPTPLHPGVVLGEVYMSEMGLNQSQLAEMWVHIQAEYDLWVTRKKAA